MILPRLIPVLLLRGQILVKTVRFKDAKYIGDPINVVRIFNEKEVDELVLLDIEATKQGRSPDYALIEAIASECFMPVAYGGGVTNAQQARELLSLGIEKIVVNTSAVEDPSLVEAIAAATGSSSVVVSMDIKKSWLGRYEVITRAGSKRSGMDPVKCALLMQERGAGELLVNSIDLDGTMGGYDLELVRQVTEAVTVPVVACGGAGSIEDLAAVLHEGGASAAAAGSLFVFQGKYRAVLVSYPAPDQLQNITGM